MAAILHQLFNHVLETARGEFVDQVEIEVHDWFHIHHQ